VVGIDTDSRNRLEADLPESYDDLRDAGQIQPFADRTRNDVQQIEPFQLIRELVLCASALRDVGGNVNYRSMKIRDVARAEPASGDTAPVGVAKCVVNRVIDRQLISAASR
jgi:hypothetical protein